ncbi:hypothetical protein [Lapidilactobacillus bayanensis]|uniref:hypothetical protein n=1 Tax=Lapidilactobacillus bayanensis TaxID=2485998 RepID=UPI000F7A66B8|nr:hypothetical protein [Lapidilactobacillus bayanensis]
MKDGLDYRKKYLHQNVEVRFKDGQVERGFIDVVDEPDDEHSDYYFVMTTDVYSFTFEGNEVKTIKLT